MPITSSLIANEPLKDLNYQRALLFQSRTNKAMRPVSNDAPPDAIIFNDPDYDETVMDFMGEDGATITQVDEAGITHTIMLSPDMLRCIFNRGLAWKTAANAA